MFQVLGFLAMSCLAMLSFNPPGVSHAPAVLSLTNQPLCGTATSTGKGRALEAGRSSLGQGCVPSIFQVALFNYHYKHANPDPEKS